MLDQEFGVLGNGSPGQQKHRSRSVDQVPPPPPGVSITPKFGYYYSSSLVITIHNRVFKSKKTRFDDWGSA